MPTPKARSASVEVPQKKSPSTPKTARHLRTPDSNLSPKERRLPRSPVVEKKRSSKVVELETQIVELKEELKAARNQFEASESYRKRAELQAEEAKKKLLESHQQYLDLSASEDARVQELSTISKDRDRAWQSELEAVTHQHNLNSAALASAMNEIHKLKIQLDMANQPEHTLPELHKARQQVTELNELTACKQSEANAMEALQKTRIELQTAKEIEEHLERTCNCLEGKLEASDNRINSLMEELRGNGRTEIDEMRKEIDDLNAELDEVEMKSQEDYTQNILQYRSAFEFMEERNSELKKELTQTEENLIELQNLKDDNLSARVAEEALSKVSSLSDEAERSNQRAERAMEQLAGVQAAKSTVEAEMRTLKVQLDQWRKAAEEAASMITSNGKFMERTGSLENGFLGHQLGSLFAEEMEDDAIRRKNGNVLKKFGVLWKKGIK